MPKHSFSFQANSSRISRFLSVLVLLTFICQSEFTDIAWGQDSSRPNIVLIMADDMGYSDIGCFGGEISTPTLDRLANNGLRLTQFYNTGRCCPTRASLLTGLYPHQAGIGWMMNDNGHDGYRGDLNSHCVTIAQVLKSAGYSTYLSGKWHVTPHVSPDGPKHNWPLQRGFDRFFGTIHGAGSYYDPNSLTLDNTQIVPDSDDFYYTDAISDHAIQFVDEHESDNPFFMYVAYTAPHWPLHAREEDIERYIGRYNTGWDALRAERYQRMVKMGIIDPNWELSERGDGIAAWPSADLRGWHRRRMEVYAAMVDRMDLGIGRIVNQLEESGKLDNTLIMFLADNGGCAEEYGSTGPLKPDPETRSSRKPMGEDELQTQMRPDFTRDGFPVRYGQGVEPGPADTYIAYGQGWANASNTPFRLYKHYVHEGGISSPFIAHWPAGIERVGELDKSPAHLIDLMATCVDLASADYPTTFKDEAIHPMEGRSLRPLFNSEPIERDALYWEHEGNRAIRQGKWKLVARGAQGEWELYDLDQDRTETKNLAQEYPDRVKELSEKWEAYAQRTNVYPLRPWDKSQSTNFNRKQTEFTLKQGDTLDREKSPYAVNRGLSISGTFSSQAPNGVIVSQGGSAWGYSFYLKDSKPTFAIRRQGKLTLASSEKPLAEGEHQFHLTWSVEGDLKLLVDAKSSIDASVGAPLSQMPVDGLDVGLDQSGAVGEYSTPNRIEGPISIKIELDK